MWHLFLFLFLLLHFQVILSLSSSPSSNKLCSPEESFALLHFRNSIWYDAQNCIYLPDTKWVSSWVENTDCCSLWDGVTCDTFTGHVIGLDLSSSCLSGTIDANSSLFLLHHLQKLNLAFNGFKYNFSSKFSQFKELTHLNLSEMHLLGPFPTEFFYLSKLVSLDLSSGANQLELSRDSSNKMLQNLTKLRYLYLDGLNMSSVAVTSLVNLSSSLRSLSLEGCSLDGRFPEDIFNLPFLQRLSLSGNDLLTGNLPKSNWSAPLRLLDLSFTSFSGEIPDTIGNLKYLNVLDLSRSESDEFIVQTPLGTFRGEFPTSLSKLGELTSLNLEWNALSGQLPDVFSSLNKLIVLNLGHNKFSGRLPSSAFNLPQISTLDFSYNQFEGQIPCQVSSCLLPSLQILSLQNNKLSGPIPKSILDIVNVNELDLSSNNLSGILKPEFFSKNLQRIDFSHNNLLSLKTRSSDNFTLPNLVEFGFSSCNLSEVPMFLRHAQNLQHLDLSNNKISGKISGYMFKFWKNLYYFNLSHNSLTRFDKIPTNSNLLMYLDLQSNLLRGKLFDLPTYQMVFFSVSNNKLTGEIPPSFCNFEFIEYLSLSNNSFNGTIPPCLGNFVRLYILNLQLNNFSGSIPSSFGKSNIQYLNLHSNQLEGRLPPFDNSSRLEVLDVGNNKINDIFPHSLASLPELQVLIMRSNRFYDPIDNSTARLPFPKLRILDLSHNQLCGQLPTRYIENFKAMVEGIYHDVGVKYMEPNIFTGSVDEYFSISLTMKGINRGIDRILTTLTAIDLSNNLFEGGIPGVIGNLHSLKMLNISHNKLTGHIPSSLGNLIELESLDLSTNNLSGEVPLQLTSVTSLEILNLSYNRLVGPIPKGKQFDTFQNDSYMGNFWLCGLPLSKQCGNNETREQFEPTTFHKADDISNWFIWKVTMIGYGCGLSIGLSIGYIVFVTRRPQWFVNVVERKQSMMVRWLTGRFQKGIRN